MTSSYRAKLRCLADRADIEIGVVIGPAWGPWAFEEDPADANLSIFVLSQVFNGRNHFHWYRGLTQVIDTFKPDLLHIDEEHYSVVTAQAVYIASRRGIPAIFQSWQNIYKRYPWPFSGIERFVFNRVVAGIAGTESIAQVLRQKGFAKPIAIIPLGTDTELFYHDPNPGYRTRWGLENRYAVGFVGRLVESKGLEDLLHAAAPLFSQYPDLALVVAGQGPYRDAAQAWLATQGWSDKVIWIPWLASHEMPKLMNSLDVLVVPSRTTPRWKEQFGRVITEAMAVGLPVIGSSSGEIPQVIGDAGLVFPEGDATKLSEQISRLYHDAALRQRLSSDGQTRVAAHFSQEVIATRLYALYQELLDASSTLLPDA